MMMKYQYCRNKRIRGILARIYMQRVLINPQDPMYSASDVSLARKLNVSRLTIVNIRKELNLKNRKNRIVALLNQIDTQTLTMKELSSKLALKYQNTYQVVKTMGLKTLPDKKPIESMIEYQMQRKKTRG